MTRDETTLDLERLWASAVKDDFGDLVPSDVRQLIGEVGRLRAALKAKEAEVDIMTSKWRGLMVTAATQAESLKVAREGLTTLMRRGQEADQLDKGVDGYWLETFARDTLAKIGGGS